MEKPQAEPLSLPANYFLQHFAYREAHPVPFVNFEEQVSRIPNGLSVCGTGVHVGKSERRSVTLRPPPTETNLVSSLVRPKPP